MSSTNSLFSMSEHVIFKRSLIVEHDGKLFRYTEKIEELTQIANVETIDLTMDDASKPHAANSVNLDSPSNEIPGSAINNQVIDLTRLMSSPVLSNSNDSNTATRNTVGSNTASSPVYQPVSPYWDYEMGMGSPGSVQTSPVYSFDDDGF